MELRGNHITIGELLKNPQARRIGQQEFPQLMSPAALSIVKDMPLGQVLSIFGGGISRKRLEHILSRLREI